MPNDYRDSFRPSNLERALNACSSSKCGFTAQGLQCNGRRCLDDSLRTGRQVFSLQRVRGELYSGDIPSEQQDLSPPMENERTEYYTEMVQTCYQLPAVHLMLQSEDEVQADLSRAWRGFSIIADLEASEPQKRYMCLGSQFQTETQVFDTRRLSGSTFAKPRGRVESFETKVNRVVNKAKQRLHVVTEAGKLSRKATHNRYSGEQLKEANKRLARLSLTREAEKARTQLAKEDKDIRKRLKRLEEAKEADMKLAKARAEQGQTGRS
ncbi:hypothetical protein N7G274_010332 [Stereocaulon virgatum]|uniref:Uncharacterized protein n=1 Tax=Stereocaulon virgatum TaxID=373712 RepID=A0ABR3ZTQ5_9LECA